MRKSSELSLAAKVEFLRQPDPYPDSPAAIEAIETDLAERLVEQFGVDLNCLAFDATNFFTFIDTRNGKYVSRAKES